MSDSNTSFQQEDIVELLADANYCLMTLGDLRREYSTIESVSMRMEGGGEDWNFTSVRDEADFKDAARRIEALKPRLIDLLPKILNWGAQHELEVGENLEMLDWPNASSGVKAEVCGEFEFDVRNVTNAMLVEQLKEQLGDSDLEQAPALTKSERLTLIALASFDPSILSSATDVAEAMPDSERRSPRTIGPAIAKLETLGLTERPEGDKQGARLTIKGRRLASKIAE